MLGIKRSTFYRWYDRFRSGGPEALEDKPSKPDRVWNRIPDDIRQRVVMMAFEQPELSPRELATRFTDTNSYYVSESSVYRLLKAHDLIGAQPSSSSRPPTSSRKRQLRPTSSGRPTSPISRSSAGAGTTSPRSSMTTRATLSLGSCARRCVPTTSPIHLSWRWWPQAATAPRSCTNHDCSAIIDRATSPAILPNG